MKNRTLSFFILLSTTIILATAISLISPVWVMYGHDVGALVHTVLLLIAAVGVGFFLCFSVGTIPVVLSVWAIFFSLKISKPNFAGKLAAAVTNPAILAVAGLVLIAVVPPLNPADIWMYGRAPATFLLVVVLIHQVILKSSLLLIEKVRLSKTVKKLKAHA